MENRFNGLNPLFIGEVSSTSFFSLPPRQIVTCLNPLFIGEVSSTQ